MLFGKIACDKGFSTLTDTFDYQWFMIWCLFPFQKTVFDFSFQHNASFTGLQPQNYTFLTEKNTFLTLF